MALAVSFLKQLPGLRRLRLFVDGVFSRSHWSNWNSLADANPLDMPGLKVLFSLRGIADIQVRDRDLDEQLVKMKKENKTLNFLPSTRRHYVFSVAKILAHLNAALVDAQFGKVNKKLLDDHQWHLKDPFPNGDTD